LDGRVVAAARLGELWGTDPKQLLNCSDEEWIIRYACAKVIEADRAEQERKMNKNK
jgi:hypothetical protein